jgi:hypothetical protein
MLTVLSDVPISLSSCESMDQTLPLDSFRYTKPFASSRECERYDRESNEDETAVSREIR